ncbi:hypothetical protein HY991_00980 [Candidatus Micrarchaeota archaeon]|nr:hypothetical protein [Candidatus Micrarchaeota archaeon]
MSVNEFKQRLEKKGNLLSIFITSLIIAILLFTVPAQAFTMGTPVVQASGVSFVTIRIPFTKVTDEVIDYNNVSAILYASGITPVTGTLLSCTTNGTSDYSYGYDVFGYGYGYDYGTLSYGYNEEGGYGYSYGYGYLRDVSGTFDCTFNFTGLPAGTYSNAQVAGYINGVLIDTKTVDSAFTVLPISGDPTINWVSVAEQDIFYSFVSGNNVINLRVNATNVTTTDWVTANFSGLKAGLSCDSNPANGTFNLTYNVSLKLYVGACDVTAEAVSSDFAGAQVPVTIYKSSDPTKTAVGSKILVLYNMTTPPSDPTGCHAFGSGTINMSTVTDFGSVNLVLYHQLNGNSTCDPNNELPGDGLRNVMMWNFTSVNMSTYEQAQRMSTLRTAIQVNITGPGKYGNSRIYVNVSAFTALGTATKIAMYNLPFQTAPNIVADNSSNAVTSIVWASNGYDSTFGMWTGNLSFTVSNFSGYNITDNMTPLVTFVSPVQGATVNDTTPNINITINGTGTTVSAVYMFINSMLNATYYSNGTTSSGFQCANVSTGSEAIFCNYTVTSDLGNSTTPKNLSVIAYDYGTTAPGNKQVSWINFTVLPPGYMLLNTTTTVNSAQTEVVVTSDSGAASVTVPSGINATLNLSGVQNNTAYVNATLTNALNVSTQASVNVSIQFPAGLVINSSPSWTGDINLPQVMGSAAVTPATPSGYTLSGVEAIELGFGNVTLNFSKGVRVLFTGKAGKSLGYSRNGVFTAVSTTCANDSQVAGDALSAGGDCKIDVGSDLVMWTKHFTEFVTYTLTAPITGGTPSVPTGGGTNATTTTIPVTSTTTGRTTSTTIRGTTTTAEVTLGEATAKIKEAETLLADAKAANLDTSTAEALLAEAKSLANAGKYREALAKAIEAINNLKSLMAGVPSPSPEAGAIAGMDTVMWLIVIVAVLFILAGYYLVSQKKPRHRR